MEEHVGAEASLWEPVLPEERARLVNLCAYWTKDRELAQDLAQETLIEAWRHRQKLRDASGRSRWLSAIARNVCLRWRREHTQNLARSAEGDEEVRFALEALPDPRVDLEIELEWEELAELLDRALALLPSDTREALVQKYILESPQAEIAARLGVTEGAVEARLKRGKLALHRILTTDLRETAATYGLIGADSLEWQQTRIWCAECGQQRLCGKLPDGTGAFELHCPKCSWEPDIFFAQTMRMPFLDVVKGYKASLRRFMSWMDGYLRPALATGTVQCRSCGHATPLHLQMPPWVPARLRERRGVYVKCEACGNSSYEELDFLALNLAEGQAFWRKHPRVRTLLQQEIDFEGHPALLVRFESITDLAQLHVVVARENYRVLGVRANP